MAIMTNKDELRISPDAATAYKAAAADFAQRAIECVNNRGICTVVLSGGDSAKFFFDSILRYHKQEIPWQNLHFFSADERYLPIDNPQNNYHNAQLHLFSQVNVPVANIHRMPTEYSDPATAAQAYEDMLRQFFNVSATMAPQFDMTYLGLGSNAHTASLMPDTDLVRQYINNPGLDFKYKLVANLLDPATKIERITLTPVAINNSSAIMFVVAGDNKATAVWEVLEGPAAPLQYPAQLIKCLHGKNLWYLDHAAATKLSISN